MQPWFGEEEASALADYMRGGGWITEFKKTQEFEQQIACWTGAKHCVVVNNGTVSLTLAALACGLKAGDEVIVPNFTMIATPNSIVLFGAVPVFVDVEETTLCLDLEKAKRAVTDRTKAIMLVTANGRYPKPGIDAFTTFCTERGLILIEDAAQSLGSFYPDGRHIGRAGRVGSFSFSAPKVISTGQGGALITDDDVLADRMRRLKDFGRTQGGLDVHGSIGYNFKFTELQAVVGIEQMKKLPQRLARKKEIYRRFKQGLTGLAQVLFFDQDLEHTSPWFIDVLAERRSGLQTHLKALGIGSRAMYPPINKQEAYRVPGEHPVSNRVGEEGLWLPSFAQLTDAEVDRVVRGIKDYYAKS
jgi:perosamine synthetase